MVHGFQYISSAPVLHYLQAVFFFIKIWTLFMNILYNTLKWVGTKDHFSPVKYLVPPLIERPDGV
jgi:hypothetical protein